jgi:hypothetical protein
VTTASPTYQPQPHLGTPARKLIAVASVVLALGVAILAVTLSNSSPRTAAHHAAHAPQAVTSYQPMIHYRGTGAAPVVQRPSAAPTPRLDAYPRPDNFYGATP